jgi:hypothetical protein
MAATTIEKPLLPVLDANEFDGMVLGFARTEAGALRIAQKWHKSRGFNTTVRVEKVSSIRVTHDPDINTKSQANRANAAGSGWAIAFSQPAQ